MKGGFTLVELLLALLLLQIGLLATAGMILLAQRSLVRAELVVRATLEAEAVADSLLGEGALGEGALARPWGELRWEPAEEGGGAVRVVGVSATGLDTLAGVTAWPLRGTFRDPGGS